MYKLVVNKLTVIILLLFAGCTVTLQNAAANDPIAKLNRGLIDSSIVDTLPMEEKYNEYLVGCLTENRRYPDISSIINSVSSDLLSALLPFMENNKLKYGDTLEFLIESSGVAKCIGFPLHREIDTLLVQAVNKKLSNTNFGVTKDSLFSAFFQIIIINDNENSAIKVSEKIKYSNERRSRGSIQNVITSYLDELTTLYNRRLGQKHGLAGKITVKFIIDPYGRVISTSIVESTVNDTLLEQATLQQIMHWKFAHILSNRDITECVYPFIYNINL